MDSTATFTQAEIELIQTALVYLRNMTIATTFESAGHLEVEADYLELLEQLIHKVEEL